MKSRWRAVVTVICTCQYLHKKVTPDAMDGMKMQFARRNSYDEAIGEFVVQRTDSQSSGSSKGNSSPKMASKLRSASISKKVFGKELSRKKTKKSPKGVQEEPRELEQSISEDKPGKDDGYTVKRGIGSQQNKVLPKLKPHPDTPDGYERKNHTLSFSKSTSLRRGKTPPRMSLYARKYDNVMPTSRSSNRMTLRHLASGKFHDHACGFVCVMALQGGVQLT